MATEILRPNAAGDETNISVQDPEEGEHWDKVDEETPDGDSTHVRTTAADYERDLYNISDHSEGSGTINHIKVYVCCCTGWIPYQASIKIAIKSTSVHESNEFTLNEGYGVYEVFSYQWDTNPDTGSAWTWSEIDDLQIGVALRTVKEGEAWYSACTQAYVEVDYTVITEKSSSDTGSGADAKASGNPIATLAKSDTGSGSDVLSQAQAILDGAETGSGTDAILALLGKTASETGSGVDAVDSLETPTAKSSSDAGSGAEGTPVQSAILVGSETGSGIEGTPVPSATLIGSETGSGVEALIARLLAALETGVSAEDSSVEMEGLPKDLFASELGEGSDSLIAKIEMPTKGGGMKLWT